VRAINDHARRRIVDVVVVNTKSITPRLQKRYADQRAHPVENDLDRLADMNVRVITRDLAAENEKVRHDPQALADVAVELASAARRRRLRAMTA
jgi:2-phospho-L-lactate transferase/gluconeogenesis factor (CofD/UPF0052 family)